MYAPNLANVETFDNCSWLEMRLIFVHCIKKLTLCSFHIHVLIHICDAKCLNASGSRRFRSTLLSSSFAQVFDFCEISPNSSFSLLRAFLEISLFSMVGHVGVILQRL